MKFIINLFASFSLLLSFGFTQLHAAGEMKEPMHPDWSFEGPLGKFERASLQESIRFTEVVQDVIREPLSYRNLIEEGGPEFSESQAKAMAATFGKAAPNTDGEVEMRPAILSDKFVSPYENEQQEGLQTAALIPRIYL